MCDFLFSVYDCDFRLQSFMKNFGINFYKLNLMHIFWFAVSFMAEALKLCDLV